MASFIAFLVVIMPVPFVYVLLDNILPTEDASALSVNAFLATAGFWFVVAVLYYVSRVKGSSGSEGVDEGMST